MHAIIRNQYLFMKENMISIKKKIIIKEQGEELRNPCDKNYQIISFKVNIYCVFIQVTSLSE